MHNVFSSKIHSAKGSELVFLLLSIGSVSIGSVLEHTSQQFQLQIKHAFTQQQKQTR